MRSGVTARRRPRLSLPERPGVPLEALGCSLLGADGRAGRDGVLAAALRARTCHGVRVAHYVHVHRAAGVGVRSSCPRALRRGNTFPHQQLSQVRAEAGGKGGERHRRGVLPPSDGALAAAAANSFGGLTPPPAAAAATAGPPSRSASSCILPSSMGSSATMAACSSDKGSRQQRRSARSDSPTTTAVASSTTQPKRRSTLCTLPACHLFGCAPVASSTSPNATANTRVRVSSSSMSAPANGERHGERVCSFLPAPCETGGKSSWGVGVVVVCVCLCVCCVLCVCVCWACVCWRGWGMGGAAGGTLQHPGPGWRARQLECGDAGHHRAEDCCQ